MTTPTADMTPAGVAELMLQEGTILRWYRDATGTWTCCTGHTGMAGAPFYTAGQTFTREQAATILASDLRRIYMPGVDRLVTRPMALHERDAFGSFAFNAGLGNFGRSGMLRCFNGGDKRGAADAFLAWTRSKGIVLPGLVMRRQVERGMFLTGAYPGVALAPADTAQALNARHTVVRGAEGDDVYALQRELGAAGVPVPVDGQFGPATVTAVLAFQRRQGLTPDGAVGLKTWMALDAAAAPRAA